MSKNTQFLMRFVVSLAFLVVIVGCNAASAQTEVTGEWTGSLNKPNSFHKEKRKPAKNDAIGEVDEQDVEDIVKQGLEPKGDRIYLNFERRSTNGGHNDMGAHVCL